MTSEPTLYQHDGEIRSSDGHIFTPAEQVRNAIEWGMVPVEACVHGNIDGHLMRKAANPGWIDEWCPGAGIGGDDG